MYHREYFLYDSRRPIVEDELQIPLLEGLFNDALQGVRICEAILRTRSGNGLPLAPPPHRNSRTR